LKKALANANQSLIELEEIGKENKNLHELLNMAHSINVKSVGAHVIASNVLTEFKTLTIDKGHADGIAKNMVVLGPGGLVGRIGQIGANQSSVFLISDPNSAVDVYVERSGGRALLVGTSYGSSLRPFYSLSRLEYLRKTSDIRNGDVVITSGLDKLFPAGIPVGTIHNAENSTTGLFKKAEVVPFVDLMEAKEVSVIIK
ncbi:MAG: rod shape-determining protein MreC, partial [Deltaproteobacteria bacterium]|nr:rod shape-determining protein MreC [Deltaproteobacteria bacterium]